MERKVGIVKNILNLLKKLLFVLLAGLGLYLVCALLFSLLPTHPPQQTCRSKNTVFIASNGVHLDIILPVELLDTEFKQNLDILPGAKYVAFGWGDKKFYIHTPEWSDLTLPVAFNALFLKSETAMHVTCLPSAFPNWKKVQLCHRQIIHLNSYIKNSFKIDDRGRFLKLKFDGYSRYDTFYEANGNFSLFRTCNVWVNIALKEIEVKTAVWSPFDFGVVYHLKPIK